MAASWTAVIIEHLVRLICEIVIGTVSLLFYVFGLLKYGPSEWLYVKKRHERPEILDSEQFGTHHWIPLKRSRIKLHYVINGPKDKPLMLFLHGFPEFWYSWRHQLKEFSKEYRTVAVDMRGYGDSDKPRGIHQYTADKLTDDIDQLIAILGYEKVILVGHDWGGAVAWFYAMKHHEKIDKLIVCNCPHPVAFRKFISSSWSQFTKSWYMFLFQIPILPILMMRVRDMKRVSAAFCGKQMGAKPGTFTAEDIELYKYTFAEYSDWCGPINYYRASLSKPIDTWPKNKLPCPTLMVWGTKDGALEKQLASLSGNYVENYTLRNIDGASHWVHQEEPEQVNNAIREFLVKKQD